jgi:hypothetical protein
MFDLIIKIGLFLTVLPALLYAAMLALAGMAALLGFVADKLNAAKSAYTSSEVREHRDETSAADQPRIMYIPRDVGLRARIASAERFAQVNFAQSLEQRGIPSSGHEIIVDYDFMTLALRDGQTGETFEASIEEHNPPQKLFARFAEAQGAKVDLRNDYLDELGCFEEVFNFQLADLALNIDNIPHQGVFKSPLRPPPMPVPASS